MLRRKWNGHGAVAEAAIQRLGRVEARVDRESGRHRRAQGEAVGESGKESELGALEADDFDREAVASHEQPRAAFDAAQSLYRRSGDGAVAVPFSLFPQNPWRWMAAGALPE